MATVERALNGSGASPAYDERSGAGRTSERASEIEGWQTGPAGEVASATTDDLDDQFCREAATAEAALRRCSDLRTAGDDLASAGDDAGDDDDVDADPASGIQIIDADALHRELGSDVFGDPADGPEPASPEDERRLAILRRHAAAPSGLFRRHVVAGPDALERLAALGREAPNAARVVEVVERAATLSWRAGSPLRVPPVLIVGEPGTGKSRIARRIAEALGVTMTTLDGGATTDRGPIVGHDVGYRGCGPGQVARALLDGSTAGPLVLFDEVDKVSAYTHGVQPLNALLPLLEPGTAGRFVDTWVGVPLRAEGVIWVMTANSVAGLPAPLLDRVLVLEMPRLGRAEVRDALRRIFADLLAEQGLPHAALGDAALDRLQTAGLRQARRTLLLALGPALAAGRTAPDAADIAGASALAGRPAPRPRRAVPPKPAKPLGPVGFIHFAPERGTGERRAPAMSDPG